VPRGFRLAARSIWALSLLLLGATIVSGAFFYVQAAHTDNRVEMQRRQALSGGVEKFSAAFANPGGIDLASLGLLEEISGVKNLRWEAAPVERDRESQSVMDGNGRILGWLTWDANRPTTEAAIRLMPLLLAFLTGLLALTGLSIWQTRRIARELMYGEERAHRLGSEDALTGFSNATAIYEALEGVLASREPDQGVSLIYADLEGFRELSDSIGRLWSDELIRAVALRLSATFPPGATRSRFGRHKFVIILQSVTAQEAFRFAQSIVETIAPPFHVQGQGVQINATVGVAHAPRDGLSADELVRHATLAMRAAKRLNRGGTALNYEPEMEARLHNRRFIERELKRALAENALDIHYQPIVTAEGSHIVGVEALLRWNHPVRGNIPPMEFVPIAEQTGMMTQLGEFVLRRALTDAMRWPDLYIAINLSPIQVKNRALFTLVASILAETGIPPSRVVLEITEGVLMDDPVEMKKRVEELRGLGVQVALDDFGSGYSSLSYLQSFSFDKLKIDRGFVTQLGRSGNSGVIIQAIVALGRALGLTVLVEGVETEEQRILLRLAGCDEMQGFLFAKPAGREAIDKLLLEAKLRGAASATGAMLQGSDGEKTRAAGF
jgi:diguanylate cyclase (GGDEF)-like protein